MTRDPIYRYPISIPYRGHGPAATTAGFSISFIIRLFFCLLRNPLSSLVKKCLALRENGNHIRGNLAGNFLSPEF